MGIKKVIECKQPEWTAKDKIAYSWCLNHGIKIGVFAASPGLKNEFWYIQVTAKGNKVKSPREYNRLEIWDKVFELYRFYYDKNNR